MNDYAKYLKRIGISDIEEAKRLQLHPKEGRIYIWRYRTGVCVPSMKTINKIHRMSKGEVSHASWFMPMRKPRKAKAQPSCS